MKKFLTSRIFVAIITAVVVGGIGVYAGSQIFASDITYNNTTVDKALDDLYNKATETITNKDTTILSLNNELDKYSTLSFPLYNDTSSTGTQWSMVGIGANLRDKYNTFNITNLTRDGSNPTCTIKGYSSGEISLEYNTDYSTSYTSDIRLIAEASSTSWGRCRVTITFFNK